MLLRHVASLHSVNHAARPLQSLTHHNIRQNRSGATPAVCSATNQGQLQQRMARGSSNNGSGPDGRDAGDNPVGLTIRTVYGVGGPHTIRWGLLKRPVEPVAQDGSTLSWQDFRAQTEPERQKLRQQFAERLEVISYPERKRRATVGYVVLGLVAVSAAAAVGLHAPTQLRAALGLPLFFGIGFVDSSMCGLCTESMAGAWDVDDRGLEYMPRVDLARRIQAKVLRLYARDAAVAAVVTALLCRL